MQEKIKINGVEIWQPDSNLNYDFETTYTDDSTRTQSGEDHFTTMFTVERLNYNATNIPAEKASEILNQIIKGEIFTLHYFSLFYCRWRDGLFRVGKGQCSIGSLEEGNENLSSLSFNMTGVHPI